MPGHQAKTPSRPLWTWKQGPCLTGYHYGRPPNRQLIGLGQGARDGRRGNGRILLLMEERRRRLKLDLTHVTRLGPDKSCLGIFMVHLFTRELHSSSSFSSLPQQASLFSFPFPFPFPDSRTRSSVVFIHELSPGNAIRRRRIRRPTRYSDLAAAHTGHLRRISRLQVHQSTPNALTKLRRKMLLSLIKLRKMDCTCRSRNNQMMVRSNFGSNRRPLHRIVYLLTTIGLRCIGAYAT